MYSLKSTLTSVIYRKGGATLVVENQFWNYLAMSVLIMLQFTIKADTTEQWIFSRL